MTTVEYDETEMRAAIKKLMDIKDDLDNDRYMARSLGRLQRPGDAPETKQYHARLAGERLPAILKGHNDLKKTVDDAIQGLVAVDRQYNNGELASEFGFRRIEA